MQFSYKVSDAFGKIELGTEEAESRDQLVSRLKAQGKYPLEIKEKLQLFSLQFKGKGFSPQERLNFTQQLGSLLDAGVPLERALGILGKLKFSPQMGHVVNQIQRSLQEGLAFSAALERFPNCFPPLFTNMVRAGEAGGILAPVLNRLAKYLDEEITLKRFIISSLIYPMILMALTLMSILFYVGNVIPQFKAIFSDMGAELPLVTQLVMFFGGILFDYWYVILILIGVGIAWWFKEKSSIEGRLRIDRIKLKLPFIGTVLEKITISKMTLALSLLFESGVSLLTGLSIAADVMENSYLAKMLKEVDLDIRRGNSLSDSMAAKQVFPILAVEMIGVGEESGNLGPMLNQIAVTYEGEVKHSMTIFLSIFEPMMLLVMTAVIAILVMAIMLPLINMNNSINPTS